MADSVGGQTCSLVLRPLAGSTNRVETWTIPGLNGVGAAVVGAGGAPFTLTCVLFGTAANVLAWLAAVEALVGSLVTVVKDGASYPSVLVTACGPREYKGIIYQGSAGLRGQITLTCQRGA